MSQKLATFLAYLEKNPEDRFALYGVALEHKKAGRMAEAEAAFERLLSAHPQSGAGHYQRGELYQESGQLGRARSAWEAGLQALKGSTDPEARRSRSEIEGALDALEDLLDED